MYDVNIIVITGVKYHMSCLLKAKKNISRSFDVFNGRVSPS